jgi:hypothetical protein
MSMEQRLVVHDIERMSLLGLMLAGVIRNNLATAQGAAVARRLKGSLGVTAGRMKITLRFAPDGVHLTRGHEMDLTARVRGSLDGLLQVSLGRGPIKAFLAGEVSFSGNPFFVLKVLPLMRVARGDKKREP